MAADTASREVTLCERAVQ